MKNPWRTRPARRELPLYVAVWGALITLLAIAVLVLWLLADPERLELLNPRGELLAWRYRLTVALGIATAAGAVVLLVVNYRKQKLAETSQFVARFGAATSQLGDNSPTVRLGGAYALAALADESPAQRQQCIDVLCAYLRLPYLPSLENSLVSEMVQERTWPAGRGAGTERRTLVLRPQDREVRLTIIRLIRNHLQHDSPVSWRGHDFDFTGATFDGGDFSGCEFFSGKVTFDRAQFTSTVTFDDAWFSLGVVSFDRAQFTSTVTFDRARFTRGAVTFSGAQFTSGTVTFTQSWISRGLVTFSGAQFTGGDVSFNGAKFNRGNVTFYGASFTGGNVSFNRAYFIRGDVSFDRAEFAGGNVTFNEASFISGSRFGRGAVTFDRAEFAGGNVTFDDASFRGGKVTFNQAEFTGGNVTMNHEPFRGN